MHAMIRRYKTGSVGEVVKRIEKDFLSVITSAPGFIAYYVIDESNGMQSSISIFENKEYAEYSNRLAEYWVKEHAGFLLDSPDYTSGDVVVYREQDVKAIAV
ncbi:MAG: hypothetical protein OEZ59_14015 [Deltaproteobacteria bacterium]|nr:hypothetical protein [Deltaproteobacteria bacterium]